MARKLLNKISVKVFIITFVMQMLCGILICFVMDKMTPEMAYRPADEMDDLVMELESHTKEEGSGIVDEFISRTGMDLVFYRLEDYRVAAYNEVVTDIGELTLKNSEEVNNELDALSDDIGNYGSFGVTFTDDETEYVVFYFDHGLEENMVSHAVTKSYPLMIAIVTVLSLICSYIYTLIFAKPVKELSKATKAMTNMDFDIKCNDKRQDEIGDLARDFNVLSETLDQKIRELEEEIVRVRELESQKEMFFSAASHELKTPVTVLEGNIRGMLEGVGPYEDRDEYLSRSLRTVKRMESLINEILTASKMQSASEITCEKVDLTKLIRDKIDESEDLFSIRDISIDMDISEDLTFTGSKELTGLALGAFISNAVMYSKEGSTIKINAKRQDDKVVTYIENTDAHIDEEDLPHLFEAFYRADRSRSRKSGGSGLGLYLAKLIITKQGGSCSIENKEDNVLATVILPST